MLFERITGKYVCSIANSGIFFLSTANRLVSTYSEHFQSTRLRTGLRSADMRLITLHVLPKMGRIVLTWFGLSVSDRDLNAYSNRRYVTLIGDLQGICRQQGSYNTETLQRKHMKDTVS